MSEKIDVSDIKKIAPELSAGDRILLSGEIYTARDAAHMKLFELLDRGAELPFELRGAVIYYCGPTDGRGGRPFGSAGPTTSSRMDAFTPKLLDLGLAATIGKGNRNPSVIDAIVRNGSVYFCAVGGAGAILAKSIDSAEVVAFPELGCESIKKLRVTDMPLTVAIDSRGADLFKIGRESYKMA